MRKLLIILLLVAFGISKAAAQFTSFGKFPVDIVSDQETRFVGGVAIAEQNVVIRYRDTTIYSDYAEYNDETRDVLVRGNVRIYREGHTFVGDRAVYNLETKQLRAANFRGDFFPFHFSAESLTTMGPSEYVIRDASFTTSDSSKPDYYLRAKTVRIYSKDHIIFNNVALYIGKTPVFWWPYLYQSLDQNSSFSLTPGYRSKWGAFLLYSQEFPISENIVGRLNLDYRSMRGVAGGLEADYKNKESNGSWAKFRTYLIDDSTPGNYTNDNNQKVKIDPIRYRVSLQSRMYITEDIYSTIDLTKLSDKKLLEDFMPGEFRLDPQPDNVVALTKLEDNYTLTGIARIQLNNFFETTEREPELVFDMKRTAIFNSPVFYEGETGAARLNLNFPSGSIFPGYNTTRVDSFHQLVLPTTIGGWLSVIPRIGVRGTYYSSSGFTDTELTNTTTDTAVDTTTKTAVTTQTTTTTNSTVTTVTTKTTTITTVGGTSKSSTTTGIKTTTDTTNSVRIKKPGETPKTTSSSHTTETTKTSTVHNLTKNGGEFRRVFNTGLEASFKASQEWDNVQSRGLGLDGLRHVIQPYMDLSYVNSSKSPNEILQFDRLVPSDQLPNFTFPQFTGIDSISTWTVVRMGAHNRLQTRRDDETINWLTLDSYFNVNIQPPTFPGTDIQEGTFSNFYNTLIFTPVPWAQLRVTTQTPLSSQGFWEANTSLNFFVTKDLQFNVGNRYLNGNPFFPDSTLLTMGGYYRINENWGVSASEEYEVKFHTLQWQRYEVHRDLSSWIASLGLAVRDNNPNPTEYALLLTFTLKAFPIINLPFNYDPASSTLP